MTAIILDSDKHDIHDLIRYLDGDHHMGVYDRLQVVKDLKAQLPKPAVEEPELSFSVINARPPYADTVTTLTKLGDHWVDLDGNGVGPFADLAEVEVLRVGIGEPANQVSDRASVSPSADLRIAGFMAARRAMESELRRLRADAITSERQSAYDTAIATVDGLQP